MGSQTESDEVEISSSSAKKSQGSLLLSSGKKGAESILNRRELKQQDKQNEKVAKQVRFANEQAGRGNRPQPQPLLASAGSHFSFGEGQMSAERDQLQ
jgi:hypothetical protein